jgi:tetratricopeptide (TPR) repeat protein
MRRERRSSVGDETEYAFRHVLLRDVAYGEIPRGDRARLHRRAAEWIEGLGRVEDLAELRAHHWLNASQYARRAGLDASDFERRARGALLEAAERALALNNPVAARRSFTQALELWPEDGSRERLLARYNLLASAAGLAQVEDLPGVEPLRDDLLAAGLVAHAAVMESTFAWVTWDQGRTAESRAATERAVSLVADLPPSAEKLRVLDLASRRHVVDVEPEAGIERARELLALGAAIGDEAARIEALNTLGVCRIYRGDEAGFDDLDEAVRLAEELGSAAVIRGYKNAGSLRVTRGELAEGFQLQGLGLRAAERFGSDYEVLWFIGERAREHWWRGRFEDALADADRLVAVVEAGGSHYMELVGRWIRAYVALTRDHLASATSESAAVLELGRIHRGQMLSGALVARMTVCVAAGEWDEADALADELLAAPFVDWQASPAPAFAVLGRGGDLLATPGEPLATAWEDAGRAYLRADYVEAARRFAAMGSLPDEAEARFRAGETLLASGAVAEARAQVERALAFWRSVAAKRYVHEAEALLAAVS